MTVVSVALTYVYIGLQLPGEQKIKYVPWDFKRSAKRRGSQILTEMSPCIKKGLAQTGAFICAPSSGIEKDREGHNKQVMSLRRLQGRVLAITTLS